MKTIDVVLIAALLILMVTACTRSVSHTYIMGCHNNVDVKMEQPKTVNTSTDLTASGNKIPIQ